MDEHVGEGLMRAVEGLTKTVKANSARQDAIEAVQKRIAASEQTQFRDRLVGWSRWAVNLILIVWLVVISIRAGHNTNAIHDVQTRTSQRVLCPLYQTGVDQIAAVTPAELAKLTAVQRHLYAEEKAAILGGYHVLGCHPPKVSRHG